MKTSNKLLLGFFILMLVLITALMGAVKYHAKSLFITESGETITEKRPVQGFNKLRVEGDIHVILTTHTQPSLELKGDKNLLKNIETSVEDGELLIKIPFKTESHPALEVTLGTDSVTSVDFSNGASLECTQVINSKKLELNFNTGATDNMEIASAETSLHCSTGAVLELKGSTGSFGVNSSTGAIVNALALSAKDGTIEGTTGAVMKVTVTGEINVTLSTGAILNCSGNPVNKSMNLNTGGIFNKL